MRRITLYTLAVVYLAAAGLLFLGIGPQQKVVRSRLSRLVAVQSPPGFPAKPAASNLTPAANSPFAEVKAASRSSGSSTGEYSVEWTKSGSSNDAVSVLASLLPTAADAAKVQSQAKALYLQSGSLKGQSYSYVGPLSVPGLSASEGALFKSTAAGNPPLAVVALQEGRAQVTEFVGLSGGSTATATTSQGPSATEAVALARSEDAHLKVVLKGFSIQETTWPLVRTLVFWIVAVSLAGAAVLVPVLRRRAHERRRVAAERMQTRHMAGRGSKIVRRHAARR